MKFSLLMPTRNRPDNIRRLVCSIAETRESNDELEIVAYVDDDDTVSEHALLRYAHTSVVRGPRINLSDMWNRCYEHASLDAEIFMLAGDDMIFRTRGWDTMVERCFEAFDDRLVLVHGDDLWFGCKMGTHCFVHRRWIETVGYFTPPMFSAEYADTWVNHVAMEIGRRIYLPFVVEHPHPEYGGKAPWDQTHLDRIARRVRDNVGKLYQDTARQRFDDSMKIFAAIRAAHPEAYPDNGEFSTTPVEQGVSNG